MTKVSSFQLILHYIFPNSYSSIDERNLEIPTITEVIPPLERNNDDIQEIKLQRQPLYLFPIEVPSIDLQEDNEFLQKGRRFSPIKQQQNNWKQKIQNWKIIFFINSQEKTKSNQTINSRFQKFFHFFQRKKNSDEEEQNPSESFLIHTK